MYQACVTKHIVDTVHSVGFVTVLIQDYDRMYLYRSIVDT